jgi:hypothetical protein
LHLDGFNIEAADGVDDAQPRPDRALGIVLMRSRVAEVDQNSVAHVFGDKTIEPGDRISNSPVVCSDDLAQILGIEPPRERGRTDQVAEHHRQLSPFGIGWRRCIARCRRQRCNGHRGAERGDRIEHPAAMASKHHAEIFEILRRELRHRVPIDFVVAERRQITLKAQTL